MNAFTAIPAEAVQRLPCEPPTFQGREAFDSLRSALSNDAFAEAYDVYVRDLEESRDKSFDLFDRMNAWRTRTCEPIRQELDQLDAAGDAYKSSECGAKEAPKEVVARCLVRKSELETWRDRIEPQRLAAIADSEALNDEVKMLAPLIHRSIANASNVLNRDNLEQAFRLYIFWAVELDKSTPSRDRDSCRTFARITTALGQKVANQEIFIDLLVRNLVERRPFDISLLAGDPPLAPVTRWGREFGNNTQAFNAKGFKKIYYDNISENQVRHAAGYMRIGYAFSGTAGDLVSLFADIRIGEKADYLLAVEAAEMGWQLRRGRLSAAGFGHAIEARVCD
ncbi:MAG: hypothetical protein NTX84_08550 [Nitrospirae bacterium]|nr:hypothetical protein [Nitrospirota bacterium]